MVSGGSAAHHYWTDARVESVNQPAGGPRHSSQGTNPVYLCQRWDCRQLAERLAPLDGITEVQPLWLLIGDDGVNVRRPHTLNAIRAKGRRNHYSGLLTLRPSTASMGSSTSSGWC